MRVTQFLLARAVRYVEILRPLYLPDVIQRFQERYKFVQVPTTAEEIFPRENSIGLLRGMSHGKFVHEGRTIVVESLTLFADAVAIDSPATTEDADIVLDDLLVHAADLMTAKPNRRAYNSGLAVTFDVPLELMFAMTTPINKALSQALATYTPDPPSTFKLASVKFAGDDEDTDTFEIERVEGSNVFHAHASLSTPHHVGILEGLEGAMRSVLEKATSSPSDQPPPS